jgi:hypothetical protein
VRVLEARFHPKGDGGFFVVGRIAWSEAPGMRSPTIELESSLVMQAEPVVILSKLKYLLSSTAPGSFERLQTLQSRFWSFVPVDSNPAHQGAA